MCWAYHHATIYTWGIFGLELWLLLACSHFELFLVLLKGSQDSLGCVQVLHDNCIQILHSHNHHCKGHLHALWILLPHISIPQNHLEPGCGLIQSNYGFPEGVLHKRGDGVLHWGAFEAVQPFPSLRLDDHILHNHELLKGIESFSVEEVVDEAGEGWVVCILQDQGLSYQT